MSEKRVVLRNYEGVITTYTEPSGYSASCGGENCPDKAYKPMDGVAKLLSGEKLTLEPAHLIRTKRHRK
jgi:lysine 2,3-aminomutase